MRLKSALRRGVAAAVIAGIVVSSGIPAYAARWDIADGDITVKGASDGSGNYNEVKQGDNEFKKDEGETVITGESKENTVTIDTSGGKVDVTFDDLKIDVSGKTEVDGSGDGGAGIGGGIGSTGSSITIRGGTVEAVGGSNAAGIGDGAGRASGDTDDPNPGHLYICGDAEVTAKAGSQTTDAKAPAIGGSYGEIPTENLSDDEHKVTGGRLTRLNADGTVMEGMGYDYTSTPTPQPDDDDDDENDAPPPAQENAPNPCPAAWWWAASFPAGSPSSGWTLRGSRRAASSPCSAA